jgi:tRNA(fMet)-specific endonuclease VapC
MAYLLDANAVIAILNDANSRVAQRVKTKEPREVAISAIVIHELYYGAYKSTRVDKNVALIDALQFEVLEFDHEDAKRAGEVRAVLATRGTPIDPYDVLIAGQANARNRTLVTNNASEFSRVSGLRTEDWAKTPESEAARGADESVSGDGTE